MASVASNDDAIDRASAPAGGALTPVDPDEPRDLVSQGKRLLRDGREWLVAGSEDPVAIQPATRVGLAIIVGFFVILGGWAAFAPLNSAVVGMGEAIVENRRRTIQHLEGGIVETVLVREGAAVKSGDTLVRLRDSRTTSERDILTSRQASLLALRARLRAEIADSALLTFPSELTRRAADPDVREAIEGQARVFNTNRTAISEQTRILQSQIDQGNEQIRGLRRQIAAAQEQGRLIDIETKDITELFEKGYERKSRVNALKRAAAQIEGQIGGLQADVERTLQANAERLQRIASIRADFVTKAATDLRQTEDDLFTANQQLVSARDRTSRMDVVAPVDGRVVALRVNSPGEVVQAAQPILDIVPMKEALVIEARISPRDVDNLTIGMDARVLFPGLSNYTSHTVHGTLTLVSADALREQDSAMSFYLARVNVPQSELKGLPIKQLVPGMPAEVMITTRKRTVLQYIFEPLYQMLSRSGHEE